MIAGYGKLQQPRAFLRSVADYQQAPQWLVPWIAATLPAIEFLAGGILVAGAFVALGGAARRFAPVLDAAAWIAAGLLAVFTVSLTVNILRGIEMDCGCFDVIGEHVPILGGSKVNWGTVARDVVLLVIAAPMLLWPAGRRLG